jgi:predicted Rdx family selenoprotein
MGQELLSTFGTSIGEIALIPATGGIFTVQLSYVPHSASVGNNAAPSEVLIWDRKSEGGFPEAKILKQLIRNHIDPEKNLGHSDTPSSNNKASTSQASKEPEAAANGHQRQPNQEVAVSNNEAPCEDCK